MSEWKEYNLDELYEFSSGLSKGRDQFGFGHGFLSYLSIFDNYFVPKELNSLVNSNENERKSCSIKRGDVFLTRTSETDVDLGISSVALKDYPNGTFNGFTKRLRPKGIINILPEYTGFYFRSPKFRTTVGSMSATTTRASLNNEMLSQLKILVPSIETQTLIAETLLPIHLEIDLFKEQNKTLAEIAETLFKQWFLKEAKDSWEETNFGAIIHQIKNRIKDSSAKAEDMKVLSAVKTGELVLSEDYFNKQVFSKDIGNYIVVKQFDFAYNPSRINIGSIGMLGENITGAVSPVYVVMRPKQNWHYYLQFMLKQQYVKSTIEIYASGSVRQSLDYDSFSKIETKLPPFEKVEMFNNYYSELLNKITANKNQIKTLTNLRETLLPKLMSGEVRVEN